MPSVAEKRAKRDVREIGQGPVMAECPITIDFRKDKWSELRAEITGPPDTPYEGGKFQVELKLPEVYPFMPPTVSFITKIWHPNISLETGAVCLDILSSKWAAGLTLRVVLLSIQALLATPDPYDPQVVIVANQFKKQHSQFLVTARHWTNVYASGPHKEAECDANVTELKNIGISEQNARMMLSRCSWDMGMVKGIFSQDNSCIHCEW